MNPVLAFDLNGNDAVLRGVSVMPCVPDPGDMYFKCLGVHLLTPKENAGNHNVFFDVFDSDGERMDGHEVMIYYPNGTIKQACVDKPLSEPGGNFPLWKGDVVMCCPIGFKADRVVGLNVNFDQGQSGATLYHESFYIAWQLARYQSNDEPPSGSILPRSEIIREYVEDGVHVVELKLWLSPLE